MLDILLGPASLALEITAALLLSCYEALQTFLMLGCRSAALKYRSW